MQAKQNISTVLLLSVLFGFCASPGWCGESEKEAKRSAVPFFCEVVADVAEKALPAVVHLDLRLKLDLSMSDTFFLDGQLMHLPFSPGRLRDIASGFIIRTDGYILTSFKAIKGCNSIKATLNDNRSYDAQLVSVDEFSDLAVVRVNAKNLPTLPWGDSKVLRPGEFAVAIGSPCGETGAVTFGIISTVNKTALDVNSNIKLILTDTPMNLGNEGGPLINLKGEVIGVNIAVRRGAERLAYSIPAAVAKLISDRLVLSTTNLHPWLGISMRVLDNESAGLPPGTRGVLVRLQQSGPAAVSGLEDNDIVQKVDGKDILVPDDLRDYIFGRNVGDVVNITVLRDNKVRTVSVTLAPSPNSETVFH
jgi:serine protease Do